MTRTARTITFFGLLGAPLVTALPATAATGIDARVAAPTAKLSWTGRPIAPLVARAAPRPGAGVVARVSPEGSLGLGEVGLLVTGVRRVRNQTWVQVMLPVRPNGTRGWVSSHALRLTANRYRILIEQGTRRLTVYRSGRRVLTTRVAVGTGSTPTPDGRFAVAEVINTGDPNGALGRWVMPLTAYSPVLRTFAGGNGRVAIHGTSRPDLLGQRVSHGCVRVGNAQISRVARVIRPGTPVTVRQ